MATTLASTDWKSQAPAFRLIACPHILSIEKGRMDVVRPAVGTLAELVKSIGWTSGGLHARVYLDGQLVPEAEWEWVNPQAGQSVIVRAVPHDSGNGKSALRIVAMVAVIAASIAIGQPEIGGAFASVSGVGTAAGWGAGLTAATSILGTLAVTALIPPSQQNMNQLSGLPTGSNTLSITGTSNQLIPYGVVPRAYGTHRMFPPQAARPFVERIGGDQYLRCVFCLGRGPLAISDMKIGETALAFFTDVQMEVRAGYPNDPPITLYPSGVHEDPLSVLISQAAGPQIRVSRDGTTSLAIDVTFPGGLYELSQQFGFLPLSVQLQVEYRLQGTSPWLPVNNQVATYASQLLDFPGANNSLLFTATTLGANGNNTLINLIDLQDQQTEFISSGGVNGPFSVVLDVVLRNINGVYSTAAQLKAFLDTATVNIGDGTGGLGPAVPLSNYFTVAHFGGSDGSGVITPFSFALTGGLDATFSMGFTDSHPIILSGGIQWAVPAAGVYEVRVTRVTGDRLQADGFVDQVYWTTLRSFKPTEQVMLPGFAGVAMRIKMTDQLNGQLDQFNCLVQSILLDWDGTNWVERPTNNPASIFLDVHTGTANARPKLTSIYTNVCLQSQTIDLAPWALNYGSVTPNATAAPDGTQTADCYFESAVTQQFAIIQIMPAAKAAGQAVTGAFSAKDNGSGVVACYLSADGQFTSFAYARFTLSGAGSVDTNGGLYIGGLYQGVTASIQSQGNGWYRCTVSVAATDPGSQVLIFCFLNMGQSYLGNPAHGTYFWGFQVETGLEAHDYLVTSAIPRSSVASYDRMDLPTIQTFHERCTALGYAFNAVIDFRTTVAALARDVLAAGRAAIGYRDGKVSVVEDIPQALPVTTFTPVNSSGFKGSKSFVDFPHALRVRFVNADTLLQDERLVLADGYGATGADGIRRDTNGQPTTLPEATKIEAVEAGLGVTDPAQIYSMQRYNLAVLTLRPEIYTLTTDFEHLVVTRGDLVRVQHDVPLFGLISGRVKSLTTDGIGRTTGITLTQSVVMEAGKRYGVRIRLQTGDQVQREVVNVPGEQTSFTLLQPV